VKINIELDKESRRAMEATLQQFADLTGKGVETGVKEIALSSARRLAMTVQPYGVGSAKGAKFIESIGMQVDAAYLGTNLGAFPATGSMAQAHRNARRNGKVPYRQFRKEKGKPWLGLITQAEKEQYKRTVQRKAGRAKAAWISAAESLGVGKMSGIAKWIRRHVPSGYGAHSLAGSGLKLEVTLENKTPYLSAIQKDRDVQKALSDGLKNGFRRLEIIVEKQLKKLSAA
jgi:hypothetical protein